MIRKKNIRWFILILPLFYAGFSHAQNPVKKTYAYTRDFIPGMVKVKMKPGGEMIKEKPVIKTTWFFFLEGNIDTAILSVRAIWIKKKRYSIDKCKTINTPFTVFGSENNVKEKIELVPLTSQKVIQVWPGLLSSKQYRSKSLARLISLNELVVEFASHEKVFYAQVKKITVLPPVEEL